MSRQIKVCDSTHEKLHHIKKVNKTGSLDGAIIHMMQGAVDELDVIQREQTAVTLSYEGYGNLNPAKRTYEIFEQKTRDITFKELRNADIGDIYEAPVGNCMNYTYDIATVVYTDEDIVVLKIKTITELEWTAQADEIRLIGVTLF